VPMAVYWRSKGSAHTHLSSGIRSIADALEVTVARSRASLRVGVPVDFSSSQNCTIPGLVEEKNRIRKTALIIRYSTKVEPNLVAKLWTNPMFVPILPAIKPVVTVVVNFCGVTGNQTCQTACFGYDLISLNSNFFSETWKLILL